MSLFVEDDENDSYKPSEVVIKEEDEEMLPAGEQEQRNMGGNFPREREEASQLRNDEEQEENGNDDDPIVGSFPLIMNQVPSKDKHSLHVLQFPGRLKSRSLNRQEHVRASIKPGSHYLDLKVPLDVDKFFNKDKVQDWGLGIEYQSLSGVLDPTESGIYAAKIVNDGTEKKIVLIPVDSSAQLRTSFKYIDDIDKRELQSRKLQQQQQQQQQHQQQQEDGGDQSGVQILQTAAKRSQNQDSHSHILGDSLKSVKKFEEEEWQHLAWKQSRDPAVEDLKESLKNGADYLKLETATTRDAFIDQTYLQ
ncbi:uncharacterized protein LODBEIA_P57740 [Lodderomyces beijingensis]|uniref:Uncharacterized protein n=1 Tax=Lodderomyces beijingensis TaxID=1775926 RepID=A0ABP0ZX09_9ASCO